MVLHVVVFFLTGIEKKMVHEINNCITALQVLRSALICSSNETTFETKTAIVSTEYIYDNPRSFSKDHLSSSEVK